MSAQDNWQRKHHELWEKLEDNNKRSFCTALEVAVTLHKRCGADYHVENRVAQLI